MLDDVDTDSNAGNVGGLHYLWNRRQPVRVTLKNMDFLKEKAFNFGVSRRLNAFPQALS